MTTITLTDADIAQELDRVRALRATLVIRHAFFASILLPMRILPSLTLPTFAATNCHDNIWLNPIWTRELTLKQLGYVLLHETGHTVLLHALRRGPRDTNLWNQACTPPGVLILGANAPIEAVSPGQPAYSGQGIGTVTSPMMRPYDGDIFTIKATGLLPIRLTPEHPVYASYRRKQGYPITLTPPSWIPAQYLRPGDYLIVPRLEGTISLNSVPLTDFLHPPYTDSLGRLVTHQHGLSKALRDGFPLTPDTAWFMGLYVAEGSKASNKTGIKFSLGLHEVRLAERISTIAASLGYRTQISRGPHSQSVTLASSILNRAFTDWFGRGAKNKHIPDFILLHKDLTIVKSFLDGYTDGDGHRSPRHSTHLATASYLLALQLQILLARLGLFGNLTKRTHAMRRIGQATLPPQTLYELVYRERHRRSLVLNPKHPPIASLSHHSQVFPTHIATQIRSITHAPYSGPVHNLVTSSHSYLLSNAIVHNCDLADNAMIDEVRDANGAPLYERPEQVNIPGIGTCSLLTADWAKELAAEEIYERLLKEAQDVPGGGTGEKGARGARGQSDPHGHRRADVQQPDDHEGQGGGSSEPDWSRIPCAPGQTCAQVPSPLTEDQAERLTDRVIAAHEAWVASQQRGTMPASLLRLIERLRRAKVPWQRILHQYAGTALAKEDFSLFPPHKRWLCESDLIWPSMRSPSLGALVVSVDTSASISQALLQAFAAEVAKLATLSEETLLLTHDAAVHQIIRTSELPRFLKTLDFKGGGGTSHIPVFDYLRERRLHPDLFIALTDLYSEYPTDTPRFPVLWTTTEDHGSPPPWGRVVVIPDQEA